MIRKPFLSNVVYVGVLIIDQVKSYSTLKFWRGMECFFSSTELTGPLYRNGSGSWLNDTRVNPNPPYLQNQYQATYDMRSMRVSYVDIPISFARRHAFFFVFSKIVP